ncbi:MAG TPA: glycogen debranching protein GlgX, partial [Polyangiaceae bacterium]|nr:glycogen debranching protein GlgX [Polyangiaceae bacterium]
MSNSRVSAVEASERAKTSSSEAPGGPNGVGAGSPSPLGSTVSNGGVNFSVFSKDATHLELLLFDSADARLPARVIRLDPRRHRTYHYWHVFVPGLRAGALYAYRAYGPLSPAQGLRFDREKVLIDPYGRAVAVPAGYDREAARRPGDNAGSATKSVVVDATSYDWEGDRPLCRPFNETVIYELHVRGFTRHESSGVAAPLAGTYAGLIQKIPYLVDLGVTAVELLPVFHFDRDDAPAGRKNYWGYQPLSFFALHPGYSSRPGPLAALDEFRDMVKALHRAGIEVILDVVFNHTTEGGVDGPTLCYRGLANDTYYLLEQDKARYADYTGCGNTLNANHPIVRRLIRESLRYWVTEMHVDGFRFDLASILARDESGRPLPSPPVLWDIETDPVLAGTKLIAEAWDAGGLYQVGSFVGDAWQEWNGRFRDDVRRFIKGEPGMVSAFVTRLLGSPDLYAHEAREAEQSVNFVACHDGFTLNDVVSYDAKHNEANGEDNRDGHNDNISRNWGVEGETTDENILEMRFRLMRSLIATLAFSQGVPMLSHGDEIARTQHGNNNAYAQDNEISWVNWNLSDRQKQLLAFTRKCLNLRHTHAVLRRRHFFRGEPTTKGGGKDLSWLKPNGEEMYNGDWNQGDNHALGMLIYGDATDETDDRG